MICVLWWDSKKVCHLQSLLLKTFSPFWMFSVASFPQGYANLNPPDLKNIPSGASGSPTTRVLVICEIVILAMTGKSCIHHLCLAFRSPLNGGQWTTAAKARPQTGGVDRVWHLVAQKTPGSSQSVASSLKELVSRNEDKCAQTPPKWTSCSRQISFWLCLPV